MATFPLTFPTTFGEEGAAAPDPTSTQAVAHRNDGRTTITHCADGQTVIVHRAEGWPKTTDSIWDGWVDPPDVPQDILKRGAAISNDRWSSIQTEMVEDRQWP